MFIVEMDSVTVVKLGNMVSPPWMKTIHVRLKESVGRLFASLNGSVTIDIEELLPNEGWASVLARLPPLSQAAAVDMDRRRTKGWRREINFMLG